MTQNQQETEIKLAVSSVPEAEALLRKARFAVTTPRSFEANELFDFPGGLLRGSRKLLRLREFRGRSIVTFKGTPQPGPHKVREEIETEVADGAALRTVFDNLGLRKTFRYEKFRTEFARENEPGGVTLDETPIGVYLELEGSAEWIDKTAKELGFRPGDYITSSYGTLYLEYCQSKNLEPSDMTFSTPGSLSV